MEFDLFDTDPLTELTTMLENVNMGRGDNGSTSSGGSTSSSTGLSGDSLENLQGSSIWSPTAHNSPSSNSSNSYTGGSSTPGSRSFEGSLEGPWSPGYHHNSCGNSSYICTTPPEKPFQDGANSSNNSWSPSSPLNTSNSSSAYSFPSSPPGLGLLNSIANNTPLSTKQTLQCLSLIQEFREQAQGNQWDTGRAAPGNTALTEALQQHLIALLLKQQPPPTPPGPIPTSPITPTPPGYHYGNTNNSSNYHAHNNNHQQNHHNINHHHHHENIHRSLRFSRDGHHVGLNETKCTWSGQLPPRNHTKPIYSCKVFLGGVPYEVSMNALQRTFRAYGNVKIEWPGKEDNPPDPKGYAYLIYENERQVKALLQNCVYQNGKENNWYYKISSKHMRFNCKDVQVIPWALSDSNYVRVQTTKLDPQKTIFVGALHGMINAEGLALIMQELFGGVVYAGIDTDRHKYPIGSARVTFNNHKSFMKAVSAAFVEIRTSKFTKKVQVDPYLEDATCSVCRLQQGPYFCRDLTCFRYFCRTCFEIHHTGESFKTHRPLMRNANRQQQNTRLPSSTAALSPTSMSAPGCC